MERYIKVENDVRLYVNDINPAGRNPILFLHGWPANYKMFEYQYNTLLPMGYRCIGVDLRGFGQSDKPVHGYDYNRQADDIRQVIEAMNLRNITLAGHSTGGAIAIRYMARHNGFGVGKLALFAAAAPSLIRRPNFPYGQTREAIEEIIRTTYEDRPQMLVNFGKMFFYSKVTQPFSDWFFSLGLAAASWSTIAVSRAWLVEELFSDLEKIHVPTQIMHGIHDQVCLYPLAIAQEKGIKGSKLITFDQSGHGLFYDQRVKFNEELVRFLG